MHAGSVPKLIPHPRLARQPVRRPHETEDSHSPCGCSLLGSFLVRLKPCLAQPFFSTLLRGRREQDASAETRPQGHPSPASSTSGHSQPPPHLRVHLISPSAKRFSLIFTYSCVWTWIMNHKGKTPTQRKEFWLMQCKAPVTKRM